MPHTSRRSSAPVASGAEAAAASVSGSGRGAQSKEGPAADTSTSREHCLRSCCSVSLRVCPELTRGLLGRVRQQQELATRAAST